MKNIFVVCCLMFCLTGCYDKVELENRAFVISMGIDKGEENKFKITLEVADLEEESKTLIVESEDSVFSAMNKIDSNISKRIYFGQTKFVVIGKEILEDQNLFKQTIDSLERNTELSRKISVLMTDKTANEILESEEKNMIGMTVSEYYINYENKSRKVFKQSIENIVSQLRNFDGAVVPKISLFEGKIRIGGAVVLKDFKLAGFLDENLNGYLFFKDMSKGSQVIAEFKGIYIPIKIVSGKTKITCYEEDEIYCNVDINVNGEIEEFIFGDEGLSDSKEKSALEHEFESIIENDILNLFYLFNEQFEVDGFGIEEILRKHNNDIYLKYKDNMNEIIKNIILIPNVKVEIESTGSIK